MVRKAIEPWSESALQKGPPLPVHAERLALPRINFARKLRTSRTARLAGSCSQNSALSELAGTFLISVGLLTAQSSLATQQAALAPHEVAAAQERNSAEESNLLPIPTDFPPLADINELPMRDVTLSNGLRVFLIEDHEVPLVKGTLVIRGGQRASPPDKAGLASIALAVQRTGGSLQHPAEQLDDSLEMMAARIEGGALPEAAVLGFECLKEDTAEVAGLLSELLTAPALPDDKILLYKGQVLNLLEHRNDNAGGIPRRELGKLLYGKNSVFAREPRAEQVESIDREDVRQYIEQWQLPDAAILGVYGDFDSWDMEKVLEDKLQGWRAEPNHPQLPIPNSPIPSTPDEPRLFLVDRPGATQASVAMGEMGVSIANPDAPALDILNEILNSFGGRLFNEIRSKEGLAYSVSGGFSTVTVDHPGLFVAGGQTAAVGDFVAALEHVLEDATLAAPSDKVLDAAKSKTLNSFVFNFSSTEAQLQRLVGFTLMGLPQDYLFSYRDKIKAVTAQDVLGAAQRHLHPRKQLVVVAADANANRGQLEKQGRPIVSLTLD